MTLSNKLSLSISLLMTLLMASVLPAQTAEEIIRRVDENMMSGSQVSTSRMVIAGRRQSRTVVSKNYSEGSARSFTEYLSPEREKGTKMLKLDDRLWIYSPSSDRIVQISGHMLKQSVMGSDLSYEDMMEERELEEVYRARLLGEEQLEDQRVYVLELTAKVEDASYESQKIWVEQEHFVPVRQEMYAKSGKLLKRISLSGIRRIGERWYPTHINYKDMLKDGNGTDFIIEEIEFDTDIPDHIFNKAALRR